MAKRLSRKALKDCPLLAPDKIGTDGARVYPAAMKDGVAGGILDPDVTHRVSKHLQQVIESDHFRLRQIMPKVGCLRSFTTARRTIADFEAVLWLRKGFGFTGDWTVRRQNDLFALCFGLQKVNEA